ncbi:MAG TPA: tetratricopeptide repeat protein [Ktedonobacteraceae bacterium]|nr:tetratricopeptide repeat protein [Ktedonobacteraceae bacterium]
MPSSRRKSLKLRKIVLTIIIAVPPLIIAALWIFFDRGLIPTICSILFNVITIFVAIGQWHWPQTPHEHEPVQPLSSLPASNSSLPSSSNARIPFDEALLPRPSRLVGRDEELAWLLKRLREGGTTALSALRGIGGIGKTALAAEAIHQTWAEQRFPGGIAVVICQRITDARQIVLQALARFDAQYSQEQDQARINMIEAARFTLEGKKALIVLDNLELEVNLAEVLAPFRAAGLTILLTARHTLPPTVVPPEACKRLDVLSLEAAIDLFAQTIGRSSTAQLTPQEYQAVEQIVQHVDCHTLAVKVFGAYAADCERDLPALARELENPQRLAHIANDEIPQETLHALSQSIDALPEQQKSIFAALTVFASTQFGRQAARALAEKLKISEPDACIDGLIRRALLDTVRNDDISQEGDYERLRLHLLLRIFAQEVFDSWPPEKREQARRAIASHYATSIASMSDTEIAADDENIAGTLAWAEAQSELQLLIQLCIGIHHFWYIRGRSEESLRYLPRALRASEELAKQAHDSQVSSWIAQLTRAYGQVLERIGKPEEAEQMFQKNLTQCRSLNDHHGEVKALRALGKLALARRGSSEAESHYQDALRIARMLQDKQGEAEVLCSLGEVAHVGGHLAEAEDSYRRALTIVRELRHRREEGEVLRSLGELLWWSGKTEEANLYFDQALSIAFTEHNPQEEGWLRAALGELALRSGRLQNAEEYIQEALKIDRKVQNRHEEAWALFCLGKLSKAQGKPGEAASHFQQSLMIYEETEDRKEMAEVLCSFAEMALWQGLPEKAEQNLLKALHIDQQLQNRRGEGRDLRYRGQCALAQGDLALARRYLKQALDIDKFVQDIREQAEVFTTLGTVAFYGERFKEAEQTFRQALDLDEKTHYDYGKGEIYQLFGELALRKKQKRRAESYLTQAHMLAQKLQNRKMECATLRVQGEVALLERQFPKAERCLLLALDIAQDINLQREVGRTLLALGMLEQQSRRMERAESYYSHASSTLTEIGDRYWMAFLALKYVQVLPGNTADPSRGRQMLAEAQQYYRKQQLPHEQDVRKIAREQGYLIDLS